MTKEVEVQERNLNLDKPFRECASLDRSVFYCRGSAWVFFFGSYSPVLPLLCDIKMFCSLFPCVQGRQSRLHLSQCGTAEKSECKTLISPDPDEGFITESAGDLHAPELLVG